MKIERGERKFDFHGIGLAIKKAREREGIPPQTKKDRRGGIYHPDGQAPQIFRVPKVSSP